MYVKFKISGTNGSARNHKLYYTREIFASLLVWYFLMLLLILLVNYSLQCYICITCLGLGKCGDRELLISSQIICSIKGILGCFSRTWRFQQ